MWLTAPNLTRTHGFSTRRGGFSSAPFDSLNFDPRQDDPDTVQRNRAHALESLGYNLGALCTLEQVHGTEVLEARAGQQVGDALVSSTVGLLLAIGTADCYPIVLEDAEAGVVGAAHAGWKGTLGRITARTVEAMLERGAKRERIRAALGPGICAGCYPVGFEVAQRFLEAGFPGSVVQTGGFTSCLSAAQAPRPTPHLDLLEANQFVLLEAGLRAEHLHAVNRCSSEPDFFSYRRDAGRTGRMWAVIGL